MKTIKNNVEDLIGMDVVEGGFSVKKRGSVLKKLFIFITFIVIIVGASLLFVAKGCDKISLCKTFFQSNNSDVKVKVANTKEEIAQNSNNDKDNGIVDLTEDNNDSADTKNQNLYNNEDEKDSNNDIQKEQEVANDNKDEKKQVEQEDTKKTISQEQYGKLVEKLIPSVVHIKGIYLSDAEDGDRWKIIQTMGGEIFPPRKVKKQGTCSGFFISEDGYIITCHHCIDDAQQVDIETSNGNIYKAKVIGYYEGADIAVLKIQPNKGEKFVSTIIGNSDELSVGDGVILIGGPLGYKFSASVGVISGKSRDVDYTGNGYREKKHTWGTAGEYIQIDAAANGGNSGGPAFNTKGEIVGALTSGFQGAQGMNFIISSKTIKEFLPRLKKGEIVAKGLLGINIAELEPYDVKALGMEKNTGMIIHNVVAGSPAEKGGLKRGDVILKVNGKEIKDKISMRNANSEIFANSISEIEVNRCGEIMKFKVKAETVREIEKLEKGEIGLQEWDDKNLSFRLLTSRMHKKYGFPFDVKGIIVSGIKDNSNPMLIINVGDVIMQVNNTKINSIEDYKKVVENLRKNKKEMALFHIYKPTRDQFVVKGSVF